MRGSGKGSGVAMAKHQHGREWECEIRKAYSDEAREIPVCEGARLATVLGKIDPGPFKEEVVEGRSRTRTGITGEIGKATRRLLHNPAMLAAFSKAAGVVEQFGLAALGGNANTTFTALTPRRDWLKIGPVGRLYCKDRGGFCTSPRDF